MEQKPHLVLVTAASEIEAIKRAGLADPIGGEHVGQWYAYDWSLAAFRKRASDSGERYG